MKWCSWSDLPDLTSERKMKIVRQRPLRPRQRGEKESMHMTSCVRTTQRCKPGTIQRRRTFEQSHVPQPSQPHPERQRQETPTPLRLSLFPFLPHALVRPSRSSAPSLSNANVPLNMPPTLRGPSSRPNKGATTTNTHTSTTRCIITSLTRSSTRISYTTVGSPRRGPIRAWRRVYARTRP